jgi:hypothetical protein
VVESDDVVLVVLRLATAITATNDFARVRHDQGLGWGRRD